MSSSRVACSVLPGMLVDSVEEDAGHPEREDWL